VLEQDCTGRAKHAHGFIPVSDLRQALGRSSRTTWQAEVLCERPGVNHAVYPSFNRVTHVREDVGLLRRPEPRWVAGLDFGLRSPLVTVIALTDELGPDGTLHILGSYAHTDRTLDQHLPAIDAYVRDLGGPPPAGFRMLAVDPAGGARNSQTGLSDIAVLRRHGWRVRSFPSRLSEGIERIRRRLDHGRLFIHPRCTALIEALERYHFDPDRPHDEQPVKDGPDHWCDALRYLILNLDLPYIAERGSYL
jgi:hypothetical protein